jgi:ketosteroid isomerase-like protein
MSADAKDVIDAICASVAVGDMGWVTEHVAPDGVFRGTVGGIDESTVLRGPHEIVRYLREVAGTWDEWHLEVEEVRRNGDTFVIFWRETSRSREIEMQTETATNFTIRHGKVVEARGYLDRNAALEAAGLS